MQAKHRVSVVIPCYNGEKYVEACIKSLIGQKSRKPYEIILVDDGSTDNTVKIAKKYRVRVVRHKTNMGAGQARTTGAKCAKGDIVAFIDADGIAPPDWTKKMVVAYEKHPYAAGIGGIGIEVGGKNLADKWRAVDGRQGHESKTPVEVPFLYGLCSSYRKTCLSEVGFFDPFFRNASEDVDIGLRIRKTGFKLLYIPDIVVFHNRKDTTVSLLKMIYRAFYFGCLAHLNVVGLFRTLKIFVPSVFLNLTKRLRQDISEHPNLIHITLMASLIEGGGPYSQSCSGPERDSDGDVSNWYRDKPNSDLRGLSVWTTLAKIGVDFRALFTLWIGHTRSSTLYPLWRTNKNAGKA